MKHLSTHRNHFQLALFLAMSLVMVAIGQIPTHAATDSARVVKYGQDDTVTVHAKLRYSTLIVLPESEEILDFATGDKEFWIINGAHNPCYIHPAQPGIRSNLNLITANGHVYSFLLSEISSHPSDLAEFLDHSHGARTDNAARSSYRVLAPIIQPSGYGVHPPAGTFSLQAETSNLRPPKNKLQGRLGHEKQHQRSDQRQSARGERQG